MQRKCKPRAKDVHSSNANLRKSRNAGAVKRRQNFSKMADESKALAEISLLYVVLV